MRTPSFRPSRHGVGSPPRPASRRRRPWELAAAVVALTALAVGGAAVSASADEPADLGPTLIRTDVAPTGYAVTFRYDAPPDVEQVHIYGDWTYAQPETITCDGCGEDRKSTRLNSSHVKISYAVFCLKKKKYHIFC